MRPSQLCSSVALAALACAGLPRAAAAQDHPVFLPTRDVAVTYQVSGGPGDPSQTTHLYYTQAGRRLRIDTPNNGGFVILDQQAGQRVMVMNQQQSYVAVPLDPGTDTGFVLNSSMTYARRGQGSVAGVPCTEWSVSSPQATGSACVTADGVLLRGEGQQANGGGRTSLLATSVEYEPQPPGLFQPPPGFRRMDESQLPPPPEAGGRPGAPPQ